MNWPLEEGWSVFLIGFAAKAVQKDMDIICAGGIPAGIAEDASQCFPEFRAQIHGTAAAPGYAYLTHFEMRG